MKIFKPKNPVKTLIAILFDGEHGRDPLDRLVLWQMRYEIATGKAVSNAAWADKTITL